MAKISVRRGVEPYLATLADGGSITEILAAEGAEPLTWRSTFRRGGDHTVALRLMLSAAASHRPAPDKRNQRLIAAGRRIAERMQEVIGDGVVLHPPMPGVAPKHGRTVGRIWWAAEMGWFNLAGVPVTQVPLGLNARGVPLGVQVAAGPERDHVAIAVALELERVFGGWVPPVYLPDGTNRRKKGRPAAEARLSRRPAAAGRRQGARAGDGERPPPAADERLRRPRVRVRALEEGAQEAEDARRDEGRRGGGLRVVPRLRLWLSRGGGVTEEQLRDLPRFRESEAFNDDEKLVLEYSEGISRTPIDVPDELFERLRARFDEGQIVELTYAAAIENLRARVNKALGIESQEYSEGAVCAIPERWARSEKRGESRRTPRRRHAAPRLARARGSRPPRRARRSARRTARRAGPSGRGRRSRRSA